MSKGMSNGMSNGMSKGITAEEARTTAALSAILSGAPTAVAVRAALRDLPHLDDEGRRRVARRVHGTAILRLRLAHLAGSDAPAALLRAYLQDVEGHDGARAPAWPADPFERLMLERSCPRPLAEVLVSSLGLEGADAFLTASNLPGPRTLRANLLRGDRDDVARALADEGVATVPGAHAPWALHVQGKANLNGLAAWRAGLFEVQDEGSQCVALACAATPLRGNTVVDLCAGRGGKTLALAALMHNDGALHVNDVDARALADQQPRLARAGVTCVRAGLPAAGQADVVLVDAPCSSLGVLRRWPDLRFSFDGATLPALVATQRALIAQAAHLCRPGGLVVYATCSVLRAEEDAARAAPDALELVREQRLFPHVHGTDGFFVASLRRR